LKKTPGKRRYCAHVYTWPLLLCSLLCRSSCVTSMNASWHSYERVTSHIWMCDSATLPVMYVHMWHIWGMCHICAVLMSHSTRIRDMGWLRFVGSLKLYVSLQNIGLFYRALLQKRPIILRSLLAEATPYDIMCAVTHSHIVVYTSAVTDSVYESRHSCTQYDETQRFVHIYACNDMSHGTRIREIYTFLLLLRYTPCYVRVCGPPIWMSHGTDMNELSKYT